MTPRRLLITRPREHAEELAAAIRALGMEPLIVPCIEFARPATFAPLDAAIKNLERYQWVFFTSRTGVNVFFERVSLAMQVVSGHLKWAAVGPGTRNALHALGIMEVWIPSRNIGESFGEELPAEPGAHVLRIRAEAASSMPAERLAERGITVDEVVAYRTVEAPTASIPPLREAFAAGVDGVIFTSGSAVRGFARLMKDAGLDETMPQPTLIAIGPVTADAIRARGWPVHLIAVDHNLEGIVHVLDRRRIDAAGVPRG